MAMYKAYPEYKDSGIEWLGDIPTHWICTQIKYGYDITLGKMLQKNKSSSKDELKPYLKAQNIQPTGIDLSVVDNMWFSPDEKNKLLLKKNDVLISEGGDVGRSAIWQGQLVECYIQNAINRARAMNGNSPYFLNYWMVYLKSSDFINTLCNKATIAHYTAEKVESSPLLLPNSDEQLHISLFLDHETAKIDNLIAKQQQLIELLKEKRQAVISHAVTKGLDPNVPMKDSGVEWLGEVPAHWELVPLKYLCNFSGGGTPTKDNLSYWQGGTVPWVSPKDMKSFWISETQDYVTPKAVSESSTNYVEEGSLLMVVRSGILQRNIPVAINIVKVTMNQDMKALRFNERMKAHYAAYFINGNVNSLLLEWTKEGATVESIEHEYLANGLIPVPPIDEQHWIIKSISDQMIRFELLEEKALTGIRLLQERRTALISAAVTGKIDVRDWVAPDTHDVEEPQEATA